MAHFTPGRNTHLDSALDLISPHSPEIAGTIELWESGKVAEYLIRRGRHRTFLLLHRSGSDELVAHIGTTGILTGGHKLPFTTRVDKIFSQIQI